MVIEMEKEQESTKKVMGEGEVRKRPKEDMVALTGCTVERNNIHPGVPAV